MRRYAVYVKETAIRLCPGCMTLERGIVHVIPSDLLIGPKGQVGR